ncbi:P-loop containing nucleoside triphosphate hydrolase protein, partial [Ilyonectria robusta]|uniref:P-loop containing nucleoside triphosphate hydrolase protein n=1 Tax=Ilyonectria robusta TaxID=1079257 RepID=UPI001E8EC53B
MIAVCGMTGTGKSTFIQRLSGKKVKVGHGLYSETYDPEEVHCTIDAHAVTLVDTPGFDDTTRTDAEVLQSLADWMEKTFVAGTLLSGIIYLHRITDVRMTHASLRNLTLFRKLCGEENLSNVMLVTSWWEVCEPEIAIAREAELKSQGTFWGTMISQGATTDRYNNQSEVAEAIVRRLLPNNPVALKIQEQLVLEQKPLAETDAGTFVHEEMIKLEKRHQENLQAVKEEM